MSWLSIILVVIMGETALFNQEEEVLKTLSERFGDQVNACRLTSRFSSEIIKEFFAYWKKGVPLNDPNMGCVINCAIDRLELVDASGKINGDNFAAFLTANGSEEPTTDALVDLLSLCKNVSKAQDTCVAALDMALCFKTGVSMIGWTPEIEQDVPEEQDYMEGI